MLAEWRAADKRLRKGGEEKLVLGGSVCSGGWVEFTKCRYSKKRIGEQEETSCYGCVRWEEWPARRERTTTENAWRITKIFEN